MRKGILICLCLLLTQTLLYGQARVNFILDKVPAYKENSLHIYMAGDFNNWNPADSAWEFHLDPTGKYYKLDKTIPKGDHKFKITRGSWESVECDSLGKDVENRTIDGRYYSVMVLLIADWKDNHPMEQKKHTASTDVHIVSEKFDIPQLGRQRKIWIYLPPDYGISKKKYPVIYMHDGQNLFDEYTSGFGEWGIDEILDKLPTNEESIVVGIDHGGDYRITEYDPYDSKYGKGRGEDYVDFLVNTLKPYIDKNYRTKKDVTHTTIAGSSMGGLISMYAILKYPDVFGNAGIFSPAFWIAPDIYQYAQQKNLSDKARIYFVCGDVEDKTMVSDMKKMTDILQSKGINEAYIPTVIMQGEKHNEKQWNKDFAAFYSWLIRGY